ncbi:hypothetical protein QYE76_033815 [Lolium multiflorum]|uniref:Integrase catalytic domain-containing protein n=1 Tax=Lolium multiflorum TaxID=4521 RepID=A0AAD8VJM6_LOLMU|nr:hypothetical protein QYE76_033815 [Lolium multiflorum]
MPYENRELHNGRLIPKDKSKDTKGKYSKAPNKKFYNNKTKKGKRPSRVVLVTREEYSSDEVESSSGDEDEESSKELAAIVTTNIPLHLSLNLPMRILLSRMHIASWQGPPWTHPSCYQLKKSIPPEMMMLMMKKMHPPMDWLLLPLSTNSSSPSESPNEVILVEEESCLMAKSSEVSSPNPSIPNVSSELGVDEASLKVKQEMLDFDDFILNLQENIEEPQDKINKLTKARDLARAKNKVFTKEKAQFGVDHEKLVKDLDELDKAHKALKSEYTLLSKSFEQLQIRLASYDVPSSSTPLCDHANIVEENARLKDELAKASSPQSKLSLDDLLSKQRSNNGKEGIGYNAKAKKANKQKAKPAQEKKKEVTNGEASKGNPMNDDNAGIANPHYVLFKDYYGDVYAKYVGPYDGYIAWTMPGGSKWVLDSGCTSHMTGGKNLVKELRPNINDITVSFGDNSTSEVLGFGKVVVAHNITLVDVMLVKTLGYNLLSVSALGKMGFAVFIDNDIVVLLWSKTLKVAFVGYREHNLYVVDFSGITTSSAMCLFGKADVDDETQQIFIDFATEVQRQHNLLIMAIRSDNGSEFKNYTLNDFLSDEGIRHQYSAAYTPQQNGVAERKNRTLMDMARSMMAEYKSRYNFWAEAISTACHSSNRLYLRKGLNKTPYEILTGNKPNISYFKVFGYQAHEIEQPQAIEEAQVQGQDGDPNDQVDQVTPPRPRKTKEEIEARRLARRERNLELRGHTHDKVLGDVRAKVSTRKQLANFSHHHAYISLVEPKKVFEALEDPDWLEAMHEELNNFKRNKVWTLVKKPKECRNVIGTKWIFKNKQDEFGNVEEQGKIGGSRLMTDRFEMSMMGEMKFFLGFEIKQLREGTFINQAKYLQDMLKRFKMTEMKGVATPMVTKCHLALDPNGKEVDQKGWRHCRRFPTGTAGRAGTAGLGSAALPLRAWVKLRARGGVRATAPFFPSACPLLPLDPSRRRRRPCSSSRRPGPFLPWSADSGRALLPSMASSSGAGGSHRSSSGKRAIPSDFDAEIPSLKKSSRRERNSAPAEPRANLLRRLRGMPIGKWPDNEYARLRQSNAYTSPKGTNCSALFWTKYQEKTFDDLYANATYKVAPMHHINFAHMDKHANYFAEARDICEQFGLVPLMKFQHPYCVEVIGQFFATVYVDNDDAKTMTWMTEGRMLHGTWDQFAACLGYPVLTGNEDGYFRAHNTPKPVEKALLADLYLEGEVVYGSQKFLRPVYDILLRIYREVLNPKVGCVDQIYGYLGNLLLLSHQHRDTGMQLDVMDFLWNEFWACIMARKAPVFAPYFMFFICSRWDNAGYGRLTDEVNLLPHKAKDLKVKTHVNPPRLPNDEDSAEEEDSDFELAPPADNGWFARIEAKLAKMFCLKSDINRRQYQAHRERKMDRRNTKLIMRKLDIPVESGSEEVITPEEEWLSKHGNVTEFEQIGLPGPSRRRHPPSDDVEPAESEEDEESEADEETESE